MIKKILKYSLITLIWIAIWQLSAMAVGQELLFPTPLSVVLRLFELGATAHFYKTVFISLFRILIGMLIGTLIGILGGLLTAFSSLAKDFFSPLLAVVKSTPVASFILLLVLWISSDTTPLIIAAMMVVPVVWSNVESGINSTDRQLLEMSDTYKMSFGAKARHIYIPSVFPYFLAALKSALGMAWKAGIAAEALLRPMVSIGKMISDAKYSLETTDLFAWTVVVIILSVIIEKVMMALFKLALKNYSFKEKGGASLG